MRTGLALATGSATTLPRHPQWKMQLVNRRLDGGLEVGGLHAADSSAVSRSCITLADVQGHGRSEALGGHAFVVGWKRGTLEAAYSMRLTMLLDYGCCQYPCYRTHIWVP
eukprot:4776776-Prymnesium_polylepis.1